MRVVQKIDCMCLCGVVFQIRPAQQARKKFCSNECKYFFYTKSTGFKRKDKGRNPSWFAVGNIPWHAGLKGKGVVKATSGSIKKGERRGISTEFTPERVIADKNVNWKGNKVGYGALHKWVERKLGRPKKCAHCGDTGKKRLDWANKSRKYKRDILDWISLCSTCHGKYDSGYRGAIKKRFGQCASQ